MLILYLNSKFLEIINYKLITKNALKLRVLEEMQNSTTKPIEAMMGRARAAELIKKFTITIDTINEVNVLYPEFVPALNEKAKLLMMVYISIIFSLKKKLIRKINLINRLEIGNNA